MAFELFPGDPAPSFTAPTPSNPNYILSTAAGRYIALCFLPRGGDSLLPGIMEKVEKIRSRFDDSTCALFFVARHPEDIAAAADQIPGIRFFLDRDEAISKLYGIVDDAGNEFPHWVLIDPMLRLIGAGPLDATSAILERLTRLPPPNGHAGVPLHAPVLILPRVFEPAFCKLLIDYYDTIGGKPSGFMREVDGVTVKMMDASHKKRSDVTIEDQKIKDAARARIIRRIVPEVEKAFAFTATRMERYIVSRYAAEEGGFFRAHRDNTTAGTAHRRFACSINLNADDYEGGDLRFAEFGSQTYRAPTGGAVVFSCSLLHEATPVTKGHRYAFLPFLYDEAAAQLRERNLSFLQPDLANYKYKPVEGMPEPS
jgi:predicted 2-oxoglutarate/Fe(II)-dependent dioxygenase YbiX/peroxiredoxin